MQPKSTSAILWAAVTIAVLVVVAILMGTSPWLVVFLAVGMAVLVLLARANGL